MRFVTGRPVVVVLALLGGGGMSVALGDPPAAADTPPSATAPATSATSTAAVTPPSDANASTAASAKTASAAQAAADNEALEKRLTNSGYKSKMRNGTKVWCKKQEEIGSRLGAQEVCATPDEWRRSFRANQEVVEQIQKIDGHVTGK
jgi:hypothetical protein